MRAAILDLLLGSPRKASAAADLLDSSGSWTDVIDRCVEWRVLPQLNRSLRERNIHLPSAARAPFRKRTAEAFLRTSRRVERGAAALEMLSREGIPCAGFKGIAAVAVLYRSPGERTLQDVDILIRKEDLSRGLNALERAGYRAPSSRSLEQYISFVRNSPGFAGNEAIEVCDQHGGSIDLHWRLGQLDTEILLARAQEVDLFGKSIRVVQPSCCATIAAHHALRNDFVPDDIVRDLLDFRDWLHWIADDDQPKEAINLAEKTRMRGAALALAQLTSEFNESPLESAWFSEVTRQDLRIAEDLVELFKGQLHGRLLNPDLVYLASPRSINRIIAGVSSGWSRYRLYMKAFEQSNGRDPVNLGFRLRQLVTAAWLMPLRRWRLVRTLVAAKNAGL